MAQTINIPVSIEFRPRKLRWTLLPGPWRTSDGEDTGDHFRPALDSKQPNLSANPWAMREEFFALREGDNESLLGFLNRWGAWRGVDCIIPTPDNPTLDESAAYIWGRHQAFRDAIARTRKEWLSAESSNILPFLIRPQSGYPPYLLSLRYCEIAIGATITIDLLNQVKFRLCARPDCGAPYKIESEHPRKYCTQYCGHLESVRKKRKESKKRRKGESHGEG